MHTLLNKTVGVRSQAALIYGLTVLWCLLFWRSLHEPELKSQFLELLVVILPFVIPIFTGILIASYCRSDRLHRRWVCGAVVAAVGCWILILGYISLAWYL